MPSAFTVRGVFRSLGFRQVFAGWDFASALVVSTVGTYFFTSNMPLVARHVSLVGDFVVIAGALIGVIIAAFAIVAALVDDRYARMMARQEVTPYDVLRHFVAEGVILVASLCASIIYRAVAAYVNGRNVTAQDALLGMTILLFVWSILGTLQIMRLLLSVAVTGMAADKGGGDV